jgi:hypothetical protein
VTRLGRSALAALLALVGGAALAGCPGGEDTVPPGYDLATCVGTPPSCGRGSTAVCFGSAWVCEGPGVDMRAAQD